MRANITFKDLQINAVEVSSITEHIFSVKVDTDFPPILIKALADAKVSISFYTSFINLIFDRKDITEYELYRF